MELTSIKSDRLYVKVADQLLKLINDGVFTAGNRLASERDLAEQLQVSRPTVREAMIALELSGVVEIRTGSGIYVTGRPARLTLSDQGVGPFEILETRLLIESDACALAATRITDAQLAALKAILRDMRSAQAIAVSSESSDWAFHRTIAEATQNTAIVSVVNWLWELRNQSLLSKAFMSRLEAQGIHPSITEHEAIVAALDAGDANAARAAMRTHLLNATDAAAQYFASVTA